MGRLPARLEGAELPRRRELKAGVSLAAAVAAALAAAVILGRETPAAAASAASLCTSGEKALFSCPVRGKIVSICKMQTGKAAYRFGRPGRVELQSRDLHVAERGYSGGGEDQVWFQANGFRYVVYAKTMRTDVGSGGRNDPQSTSGLVVQKDGHVVSSMGCGGEGDQPILSEAYHILPRGDFVEH